MSWQHHRPERGEARRQRHAFPSQQFCRRAKQQQLPVQQLHAPFALSAAATPNPASRCEAVCSMRSACWLAAGLGVLIASICRTSWIASCRIAPGHLWCQHPTECRDFIGRSQSGASAGAAGGFLGWRWRLRQRDAALRRRGRRRARQPVRSTGGSEIQVEHATQVERILVRQTLHCGGDWWHACYVHEG